MSFISVVEIQKLFCRNFRTYFPATWCSAPFGIFETFEICKYRKAFCIYHNMARAENGNWVSQKWQMDLASSVCENLSKDKFRNTKYFLHSILSGSHNGTNEIVVFRKMLENCSGQRFKLEVGRVRILLPRSQNPTLKRKKYICVIALTLVFIIFMIHVQEITKQ